MDEQTYAWGFLSVRPNTSESWGTCPLSSLWITPMEFWLNAIMHLEKWQRFAPHSHLLGIHWYRKLNRSPMLVAPQSTCTQSTLLQVSIAFIRLTSEPIHILDAVNLQLQLGEAPWWDDVPTWFFIMELSPAYNVIISLSLWTDFRRSCQQQWSSQLMLESRISKVTIKKQETLTWLLALAQMNLKERDHEALAEWTITNMSIHCHMDIPFGLEHKHHLTTNDEPRLKFRVVPKSQSLIRTIWFWY